MKISELKTLKWKIIAKGLAVALLVGVVTYLLLSPKILSFIKNFNKKSEPAPIVVESPPVILYPPTAINIPKINKNLQVKPATVNGNDWDMFSDAVAWLSTSAVPGNGNVILYAHNWRTLWADLYKLEVGDVVEVQQNGEWKTYKVSESRDVKAEDVGAVLSDENRLTLYTCEGSFDQKRRVVYAVPGT